VSCSAPSKELEIQIEALKSAHLAEACLYAVSLGRARQSSQRRAWEDNRMLSGMRVVWACVNCSAIFEADCMLVMGASGLIFGIFGLYTTDLIVNFESIHRPVMQGICVITLLIYFAWSAVRPRPLTPSPQMHHRRAETVRAFEGETWLKCSRLWYCNSPSQVRPGD